jgi:hypothetical protein
MLANSYNAEASYLTSYAVLPKFETLVATRRAWLALTAAQRAAVRRAIAGTLARARTALSGDEGQDLARLCTNGVIIDLPSPAQLAVLAREAGGPPGNAEVAATMRAIRVDVPGTGPQLSPIPVPVSVPCRTAQTVAAAISLHRLSLRTRSGKQGATMPPGNYATTVTVADLRAGGLYGTDWNKPITFTYHIHADGKVEQTQTPDYPDQGPIYGHYVLHGDEVTFIWNAASGLTPEKLRWSYFRGQLTFSIISVQDPTGQVQYVAHPWRKVS